MVKVFRLDFKGQSFSRPLYFIFFSIFFNSGKIRERWWYGSLTRSQWASAEPVFVDTPQQQVFLFFFPQILLRLESFNPQYTPEGIGGCLWCCLYVAVQIQVWIHDHTDLFVFQIFTVWSSACHFIHQDYVSLCQTKTLLQIPTRLLILHEPYKWKFTF